MIQVEFGEGVLKMVVDPFDIFYEYFDALDTVYVYTLVFQRQARLNSGKIVFWRLV